MCNLSVSHQLEEINEPLTVYKILEVKEENGNLESVFNEFTYKLKKKYTVPVSEIEAAVCTSLDPDKDDYYEFYNGFHSIKTLEGALGEMKDKFYHDDRECVLCKCTIPAKSHVSYGWWDGGNTQINNGNLDTIVSSAIIINEIIEIKDED